MAEPGIPQGGEMDPIPTGDEVLIYDYDPVWPKLFEVERARLAPAVASFAISIEHVGSTSVPGLCAKPVVDMLVTVQRLEGPEPYVAALASLGDVMRVDPANIERHAFGKRDAQGRRIIPSYRRIQLSAPCLSYEGESRAA
jgi:GrpB-like predicted nucleotidyltransferase (UPF0157 family)